MTNYSNPDKEWRARKKLGIKLTGELTAEEDKKVKVEYLKMAGVIFGEWDTIQGVGERVKPEIVERIKEGRKKKKK